MIEKRSPFYAYRYLVTPISDQMSITQVINNSKEELMTAIVKNLAIDTKTEWTKGSKRFLFYGFQSKENIYIIKFARETDEKIYVEGERDIEIKGIKEAKYIYLIIDTDNQIVLLERNVSVFQTMSSSVEILSAFFRSRMKKFDYVVNIYPLVSKKKFWSYVESADEIFELSLVMNAPNLPFFGHQDTRNILQQIKDNTNNEEFDLSFKNKEGKLKILKESLGSWIEYVREVGGKYALRFKKDGVMVTKTSEIDTSITYIERKKVDKYTDEEMQAILEKLNSINTLETREDEEED